MYHRRQGGREAEQEERRKWVEKEHQRIMNSVKGEEKGGMEGVWERREDRGKISVHLHVWIISSLHITYRIT